MFTPAVSQIQASILGDHIGGWHIAFPVDFTTISIHPNLQILSRIHAMGPAVCSQSQ